MMPPTLATTNTQSVAGCLVPASVASVLLVVHNFPTLLPYVQQNLSRPPSQWRHLRANSLSDASSRRISLVCSSVVDELPSLKLPCTDVTMQRPEQQRKDIVYMLTESFRESTFHRALPRARLLTFSPLGMMLNSIISMKVDARDPFHRMCLLAGLDGGEVYVAETPSGEIVGAAIWVIPGRSFLDTYVRSFCGRFRCRWSDTSARHRKELQTKALVPLVEALEPADSEYWMSTVCSIIGTLPFRQR